MSFTLGQSIKVTVFGQSHADAVGVIIDGIPAGEKIDNDIISELLSLRKGGGASYTTARAEADEPVILSGIKDGQTVGAPVSVMFKNGNVRSDDYDAMKYIPRPSHSDFAAYKKYNGNFDRSGGGHFSARLTLPMCYAGGLFMGLLDKRGVKIGAHIQSIGDVNDKRFDDMSDTVDELAEGLPIPVLSSDAGAKMVDLMTKTAADGDSVGGVVECKITGLPVGVGEPIYDSLESQLSYGLFGIPAVKGVEFGMGFDISKGYGSRCNDPFIIKDGEVRCSSNNSGGIQGGMTNGMPVIFRVAFKPTPSIYREQKSVDLSTMTETDLKIEGRHDSCIVPRAVACVKAMSAIIIYDALKTSGL